ncbi:quinone-dependent dihydroorotate dehydrogenase [Gulosibacter macacae]|uniref:Dihydroorotate dehydrogenase (quinone) n=1 Tax=Gulosibacter macacae TaxID=2488791 RepID=A0A3P3VTZ0_9MICO|nr:quinone-dependent dihydroorotate dehydrogenase [Gulosibacter macacae]RRJ86281.1 quinone-dependent dihydroorotate dehydrogenase [Gulosibacter macacae]
MITNIARAGYGIVFDLVFRRMDTEAAHSFAAKVIRTVGQCGMLRAAALAVSRPAASLQTRALGRTFASPFGLAAGFDKNGDMVDGLGALGFGHVEIGTVTPLAQPGNPKPRLFRIVPDRALINRMGFNNKGTEAAHVALAGRQHRDALVGVNIGKNKDTPVEDAVSDYVKAAVALRDQADYLVINVSSPNTPGLRGLQELDSLEPILRATKDAAGDVPLLVKIAPDLEDDAIRKIGELATSVGLAGVVATNTTIARTPLTTSARIVEAYGAGGLSGRPLRARSLEVLKVLRAAVPEEMCIIAVGGVRDHHDVQARLDAGATLVQGYTAFLYEGPLWAASINRGLERLRRTGR